MGSGVNPFRPQGLAERQSQRLSGKHIQGPAGRQDSYGFARNKELAVSVIANDKPINNNNMKEKETYISPQSETIEVQMEGLLAASKKPKITPKFVNPFVDNDLIWYELIWD